MAMVSSRKNGSIQSLRPLRTDPRGGLFQPVSEQRDRPIRPVPTDVVRGCLEWKIIRAAFASLTAIPKGPQEADAADVEVPGRNIRMAGENAVEVPPDVPPVFPEEGGPGVLGVT